jgi:chromosome segregation ATPase
MLTGRERQRLRHLPDDPDWLRRYLRKKNLIRDGERPEDVVPHLASEEYRRLKGAWRQYCSGGREREQMQAQFAEKDEQIARLEEAAEAYRSDRRRAGIEQTVYALRRAERRLQAEADRLHEQGDPNAEFAAEDAERIRDAIAIVSASGETL